MINFPLTQVTQDFSNISTLWQNKYFIFSNYHFNNYFLSSHAGIEKNLSYLCLEQVTQDI